MKRNNLSALLLLMGLQAQAYDYQISCYNKKLTKFENVSVNQNTDECKAFLSSGYDTCFDSKKINKSQSLITLSTPNDHYYKSKESTRYSRKKVQEIIDSAVKNGNDPYLTLAIVLTENPPVASNKKVVDGLTAAESYASDYGNIPLDAIAVADTMGCDRVQTGYDDNGMIQVKNRSPRLKKFVENAKGKNHFVCMNNKVIAGTSAEFFLMNKPGEDDCCSIVKTDPAGFEHEVIPNESDQTYSYPNRQLREKILDIMAHRYMQNRFASAEKRSAGMRLPEEKMAMYAQSFNGFGKFGVTEPMSNQCLHKAHMGTTPIYGAGTSEIMINSLMNNSEINDMVTNSLRADKQAHPESYLCASYGSGNHTVSGYAFTNLLGNYLGNRKFCPQYSNKLKNLRKFVKAEPVEVLPSSGTNPNKPANISR